MVWRRHHHILDFTSAYMVVLYVRHTTYLRGSHPLHFHSWIHQNPTPVNRVLHELLLSHQTQQQSRQSMTLTASLPPPPHQNQHTHTLTLLLCHRFVSMCDSSTFAMALFLSLHFSILFVGMTHCFSLSLSLSLSLQSPYWIINMHLGSVGREQASYDVSSSQSFAIYIIVFLSLSLSLPPPFPLSNVEFLVQSWLQLMSLSLSLTWFMIPTTVVDPWTDHKQDFGAKFTKVRAFTAWSLELTCTTPCGVIF